MLPTETGAMSGLTETDLPAWKAKAQPIAEAGRDFLVRPEIAFLNHGSFGARPRPVFEEQRRWQRELEA